MTAFTLTEAQTDLSKLLGETARSHQPILIENGVTSGVLIAQEDWQAIETVLAQFSKQETQAASAAKSSAQSPTPVTDSLIGILKPSPDSERDDYRRYLEEKYL